MTSVSKLTLAKTKPEDGDDDITLRFTPQMAREFVEMLNMNKIRNANGELLIFSWHESYGWWNLQITSYTPDYENGQFEALIKNDDLVRAEANAGD